MARIGTLRSLMAWLIGVVICVSVLPAVALAEVPAEGQVDDVTYTAVTENLTTWDAGHYEVTGEVTINSRVTVNGDVYLRLNEGSHLTVIGGIGLNGESSNITIDNVHYDPRNGELTVAGVGLYNAGIGGSKTPAGNITILGGTVTVSGGQFGAGIGSGYGSSVGKITIGRGVVNATGGQFGAGIGSGYNGSASEISISGGTVNVTGGQFGAGIGTGTSATVGTITISGGDVITNGGLQGAGIGSGFSNWNTSNVTAINITGGAVAAVGGFSAAGVGSGFCSACESIEITGGSVVAQAGEYSCALGYGREGRCDSVTIDPNGPVVIVVGASIGPLKINVIGADNVSTGGASLIEVDHNSGQTWSSNTINLATKVIIPAGCTLSIPEGKELVVATQSTLTVNGVVGIDGTLTLADGSQLVVNGTVKVNDGGTLSNKTASVSIYPGGVYEPGSGGDFKPLTVKLDANSGTFLDGVTNRQYTYWGNVTTFLPSGYDMVREGYVFTGWYEDQNGTGRSWTFVGQGFGGTELKLYAGWEKLQRDVTVLVEGGNGEASASAGKSTSGTSIKLTATPAEDYHFVRWEMNPDTVEVDQDGIFILPEHDVIATAVFEPCKMDESYVSNDEYHWQLCSVCGDIKGEKEGHTFGKTYFSDEVNHWVECEVCKRPSEIAKHAASEGYQNDATNHWKVCTTCKAELDKTGHAFEWVVDREPTETTSGSMHQECTECGYKGQPVEIPATGSGDPDPKPDPDPTPDPGPTPGPTPKPDEEVAVVDPEGGSVEVEPAPEGETATITPTPDEGEEVRDVIVTDSEGSPVEVTENPDGSYEFTMPEGGATVEVIFGCDGGELCPCRAFSDLDSGAWYHDAIDWALENGVFHGYGNGTFGPNDALFREQAAAVLCNYFGDASSAPGSGLADVADDWYADSVNWAVANGVMTGYAGTDLFGVGDALTREQFCAVIANAMKKDVSDADAAALDAFPDADGVSDWACQSVAWAVQQGVLNGVENDDGSRSLHAARGITRAEMAAMVKNAVDAGVLTK